MKRFLILILGAALCGAAPLHAQQAGPSAPDHAAALLKRAQEAAAQGDAQRAAEFARAAAELYATQPRSGQPALVAEVRSRAVAQEQERAVQEREHAMQARERAVQAHAAAAAAMPRVEGAFMHEMAPADGQEPAAPTVRWRRALPDAAGPQAPMVFAMPSAPRAQEHGHSSPAPAPHAPHQDELGMTLRLIHAEVQALRAEVQALRAEMSLMRMPGRAAGAATSHGRMDAGVWTENAGQGQREVIVVTPDGERRVVIGRQGDGGVWSTTPPEPRLHDLGAEAAQLEDVMEELHELGYVDSAAAPDREEPPSASTFRFHVAPAAGIPSAPAVPAVPATPAVPRTPRR